MFADKLREALSASRKAARDFRRALEEVAEQLAANGRRSRPALQRIPIRVSNPENPLWQQLQRRHFSTLLKGANKSFSPATFINTRVTLNVSNGVSHAARSVLYRVQPFRSSLRPRFGGCPNALYSNFVHHNARMFSTFGPDVTAQAVHNLSQGLRAFFVKGAQMKLSANACNESHVGSFNSNAAFVESIMDLARNDLSSGSAGCFIEFNLTSCARNSSVDSLPTQCFLDEDVMSDLSNFVKQRIQYQTRVINDIIIFKDNIGSPGGKRVVAPNGDIIMHFYFPSCESTKMEMLLTDCDITTGVVREYRSDHQDIADTFGRSLSSYGSILSPELTEDTSIDSSSDWYEVHEDVLSSELESLTIPEYFTPIEHSGLESPAISVR
ncbi:hypothetical protein FOA43_001233 [Brettanomyces nanus]|uniref:Uncharacterized protein n=1 Tax=Eeniella nana TaxID=13502 RepID=A0A875RYX4_EENNA|nr:uncharacterized protein FOA43_001233 [Brettanomyces nanus]QPG73918.1 hypothetical protein FOA43_001233 [Brettanomyces nanus]